MMKFGLLLSFFVIHCFVVDAQLDIDFILHSAHGLNGDPIESIKDGVQYDQSVVGTDLTLLIQFVGSPLPSSNPVVNFLFGSPVVNRTDKFPPYTLAGDQNAIGRYAPSDYLKSIGAKSITVTVYGTNQKTNDVLLTKTITFTLTNSGVATSDMKIENLFLVRANVPKRESLLSQISDGKILDLTKIFQTEPTVPQTYPLPLALYVRFKGPVQAKSSTFNFFYNSTSDDQDGTYGTIGRLNSQYDTYEILADMAKPGYKTVTINCYDDSSSPLIFTKTYRFTIVAASNFNGAPKTASVVEVAPPKASPTPAPFDSGNLPANWG